MNSDFRKNYRINSICANVFKQRILFSLFCILLLSFPLSGFSETELSSFETLETQLNSLAPTYPAPPRSIDPEIEKDTPPVQLLGITLLQNGRACTGNYPEIKGDTPLEIVGHWLPAVHYPAQFRLLVRFCSHNSRISRQQEFNVGPVIPNTAWQTGCVYQQRYTIDLPTISTMFNGAVYLSLNLTSPHWSSGRLLPLQGLRIQVTPSLEKRRNSTKDYAALFPPTTSQSLNTSFRLGYPAKVRLPIPPRPGQTLKGIAVLSAFSYGSEPQEKPICKISVNGKNKTLQTLSLRSGISTARYDYDYYPEGHLNHRKIRIVQSFEADYLNAFGAPFKKHVYLGELDCKRPSTPPTELIFQAASSEVMLDVFDIVLLYETASSTKTTQTP